MLTIEQVRKQMKDAKYQKRLAQYRLATALKLQDIERIDTEQLTIDVWNEIIQDGYITIYSM